MCRLSQVAVSVRGPLSSGVLASFGGFLFQSMVSRADSAVVAYGLSCHVACGIFLDEGSNLCFPWWQANS